MAALTYYSNNWEAPFDPYASELSSFFYPPSSLEQLPPQLLASCTNNELDFAFYDNNYIDPNQAFYSDEYRNSFPSSYHPQYQFTTPTYPAEQPFPFKQEFVSNNYPKLKRQRPEEFDREEVMFADALINDPVPTPCQNFEQFSPVKAAAPQALPDFDQFSPVLPQALPEFATAPPVFNIGSSEPSVKKPQTNLSAQSIAARERRRKITEKTQELGKLIPGAHRMNTAEMFGAAYKYIKCLQAQFGILELMRSYDQEKVEAFESEKLHGLVDSTLIQEKLYATETCLVPTKFVQELSSDHQMLRDKPNVMKEIKELVAMGEK